jgi:DNA mismatch repair protein MutH
MDGNPIGRDASWEDIREASNALLGQSFGDIAQSEMADHDATKLKGQLGELLETYYGMDHDNDPDPDFRQVEKELKCKPLKTSYGEYFYPKEPLSVGIIDYGEVAETEYWRDIEKLEKKFLDLFVVWFVHDDGPRSEWPFVWWQNWSPSDELDEQIQAEYEEVRRQVLEGEHLSQTEADNDILQTCPKHNSDFSSNEAGSFIKNNDHPTLDKPERRSWRIPTRFLVKMLADDADLELIDYGRSQYVEKDALWERSRDQATDSTSIDRFLPEGPNQAEVTDFEDD